MKKTKSVAKSVSEVKDVFPPVGTPILLTWIDTTAIPGWHYFKEGEEIDTTPRLQHSRGVLLAKGPLAITVAGTVSLTDYNIRDGADGAMDLLIIPRGCVTKVQEIP